MAKGKHAIRAAKRREREAIKAKEGAEAELSRAEDRISELQQDLRYMNALKKENKELKKRLAEGVSRRLERAEKELGRLRRQYDDAAKYVDKVAEAWRNLQDAAVVKIDAPVQEKAIALAEAMGAEVPDELKRRFRFQAIENRKHSEQAAFRLAGKKDAPRLTGEVTGGTIDNAHLLIPDDDE